MPQALLSDIFRMLSIYGHKRLARVSRLMKQISMLSASWCDTTLTHSTCTNLLSVTNVGW
jgi:hypothetical protein